MFVLRETGNDGSVRDTHYTTIDDAYHALDGKEFSDMRNACVMNGKADTVLRIRLFGDRAPNRLSDGSIVLLKPEWCTEGERKYRYRVSNIAEHSERCMITCLNSRLPIAPSEYVDIEMLMPLAEQ